MRSVRLLRSGGGEGWERGRQEGGHLVALWFVFGWSDYEAATAVVVSLPPKISSHLFLYKREKEILAHLSWPRQRIDNREPYVG